MSWENPSASIEVVHIAPGTVPVDTFSASLALSDLLKQDGHEVSYLMVMDDVLTAQRPASRVWRIAAQQITARFTEGLSDFISPIGAIYESDFIPRGLELVEEIRDKSSQTEAVKLTSSGNSLVVGSGNTKQRIRLMRYGSFDDLPSCEAMDLAMYEERVRSSDQTFTVIDESFRDQQQRVRMLCDVLGWALPVSNVFVDEQGNLTSENAVSSWLAYEGSLYLGPEYEAS